jgi:hypothetical protein
MAPASPDRLIRLGNRGNIMPRRFALSLLAGLLLCTRATADPADLRDWRTTDGKPSVRAVAIDAKYDRDSKNTLIYLKKPNGAKLTIPFDKLDSESREFAWYNVQRRRAKGLGRPFALSPPGTVKFDFTLLSPIDAANIPATTTKTGDDILLGIAPRIHELGRPPEGWCGEVAIQEAMLYFGAYYPQEQINEAGNPVHPDLYSNEIPRALKNLNADCRQWPGSRAGQRDFLAWIRKQIAAGSPVLVGVKIYPTSHEEWGLDHFVLAVGVQGDSLVLNTTWGFRYTLSERQLRSTKEGFSFANKYNTQYGIRIKAPRPLDDNDPPVRLFIQKETADRMAVIVKCEDLQPGVEYSLYNLSSTNEKNPQPQLIFTAKQQVYAVQDIIARDKPAIYRCVKMSTAQ